MRRGTAGCPGRYRGHGGTVAACHREASPPDSVPSRPSSSSASAVPPRGARLARRLAEQQLAAWGIAYGSGTARTVALVTAELASNAITHGHLPGRDFRLTLLLLPQAVRIEVHPPGPPPAPAATRSRPHPTRARDAVSS
ncbi:ATP-binding protein [Streptomyces sp. NPDC005262]|uniref:ATP-binding protein n=1 Tax=Streptomyces sp. NPDC005262 TaxID=3364710 RepID=UPI0036A963A4